MKISVDAKNSLQKQTDLLVAFVSEKQSKNPSSFFKKLDQKFSSKISQRFKKEDFKFEKMSSKLIFASASVPCDYVMIIGLGDVKKLTKEDFRKLGSKIYDQAVSINATSLSIEVPEDKDAVVSQTQAASALAEGLVLSTYKFDRYLKKETNKLKSADFHCDTKAVNEIKKEISRVELLSQGVFLTRDLINTPARDMTPKALADHAKKLPGVTTRIHNLAAIKKMKMGAFLSVAQGSSKNPPYFIEMHYKPKTKAKKKIALIGKGVTFDTGGYSMKPPKGMETMKDDMAGAAAVIGLMSIISKLNPSVEVSGYVAATENMVDGFAQVPGDVCTAMNGKTIEVLNTDAEGRLTLADALHYANKKNPDYMIDLATLTGACMVALGTRITGLMGNDDDLIEKIKTASDATGESVWQLPLPAEYDESLKSPIADLKNIGGPYGGTLTAGLFLQHFVGKTKWAHLDIAGPSWTDSKLPYTPRGGCGVMVRTLAEFLNSF